MKGGANQDGLLATSDENHENLVAFQANIRLLSL